MSSDLSPRARTWLRRAGLAGLTVTALGVVAWLAILLLMGTLLDPDRLARWAEARMEAGLNREAQIEEVSLAVFPRPAVELLDLRVANPEGFEAPPFVRADAVRLRVAFWPLFRREVVVEEVELSAAEVRLVTMGDGRSNYGDFVPADEAGAPAEKAPLRVRIREVHLAGGTLTYRRPDDGLQVAVAGIGGRAILPPEGGSGSLRLEVRADSVTARGLPGGRILPPTPARLEAEGRLSDGRLDLGAGRARLGALAVRVTGSVDSLGSPVRRLELRVEADSLEAGALARQLRETDADPGSAPAWQRLEVEGRLALDLHVRGPWGPDRTPGVEGTLGPEDLEVARPGWAGALRVPSGTVRLAGDSAWTRGLAVVTGVDTLRLDLTATGVPSRLADEGSVPSVDGALRGDRLDLDALLGRDRPESVSWSQLALARLGGREVEGLDPGNRAPGRSFLSDSLPIRGAVLIEIGELVRRPHHLADVSFWLELSPARATARDVEFTFLGGRVGGSGAVAAGGPGSAPFDLQLRATGVSAADLFATTTPVGRLTTGTADLELDVAGRIDSLLLPTPEGLGGEGRLTIRNGRFRPNPVTGALADVLRAPGLREPEIRRWEQPFRLDGDSLILEPTTPEGLPLTVRIGGSLGLGGRLGLVAAAEVGPETARTLAGRTGGLGALVSRLGEDQTIPVRLRIVGSVGDPRVRVDVGALRDALESAVRREAGEAGRRGIRSLLRGLLEEEPDTARDSIPADTARSRLPETARDSAPSDTAGSRPPDGRGPAPLRGPGPS